MYLDDALDRPDDQPINPQKGELSVDLPAQAPQVGWQSRHQLLVQRHIRQHVAGDNLFVEARFNVGPDRAGGTGHHDIGVDLAGQHPQGMDLPREIPERLLLNDETGAGAIPDGAVSVGTRHAGLRSRQYPTGRQAGDYETRKHQHAENNQPDRPLHCCFSTIAALTTPGAPALSMVAPSTPIPFCWDNRDNQPIMASKGAFSRRTWMPPAPLGSVPASELPRPDSRAERSTMTIRDSPLLL